MKFSTDCLLSRYKDRSYFAARTIFASPNIHPERTAEVANARHKRLAIARYSTRLA